MKNRGVGTLFELFPKLTVFLLILVVSVSVVVAACFAVGDLAASLYAAARIRNPGKGAQAISA